MSATYDSGLASHGTARRGSRRRWLRYPNWVLVALGIALTLLLAWDASVPRDLVFDAMLMVFLGWMVLGSCWLILTVVTLVVDQRAGLVREHRRGYWRLALFPVLLVLMYVVLAAQPAQRIRFALDRAELDAYAAQVRSGEVDLRQQAGPVQIGTLRVVKVEAEDGCVFLELTEAGIQGAGYANCPSAPRLGISDQVYEIQQLAPGWYAWYLEYYD